jgi:hypothetical protein
MVACPSPISRGGRLLNPVRGVRVALAFLPPGLTVCSEFVKCFKQEDLLLRALEGRLPLTVVVVAGAQRIRGPAADPRGVSPVASRCSDSDRVCTHTLPISPQRSRSDIERGTCHSLILQRLIEAGARVDARDAAGWTALEHATGGAGAGVGGGGGGISA